MNEKAVIYCATLAGLVVGSAVGYIAARIHLKEQYEERAAEEIAYARDYYNRYYKREEYSTPEKAVEALNREVVEEDPIMEDQYLGRPIRNVNIFDGMNSDPSSEQDRHHALTAKYSPQDRPYILPRDDFMNTEVGYSNVTLTYYSEDDVLADEDETAMDNRDEVIGEGTLEKFGHLSEDPKVVYVRNDRLEIDYEVCRFDGSFREFVLGET